jgi:hypothetical protein
MEKFNLKKLNEVECKEKYRAEVSNRLAAIVHGYETCPLKLSEEQTSSILRVFENRVLRRIFRPRGTK